MSLKFIQGKEQMSVRLDTINGCVMTKLRVGKKLITE